jgi:hypothetical protein
MKLLYLLCLLLHFSYSEKDKQQKSIGIMQASGYSNYQ